jgi:predicted dehydrogenase
VLGAGNFAQSTLLPALKTLPSVALVGVCNASGMRARHAAEKFKFAYCADSEQEILQDPDVRAIVIATRHHLHASQAVQSLQAGKHVFCEKPLCLTEAELRNIILAKSEKPGLVLMVGFNRRFAPMGIALNKFLSNIHEPLAIHYRINAGFIHADHWVNDPEQGGGRILGEVCHFVDFVSFLAGSTPSEVRAEVIGNSGQYSFDNVTATLSFPNGTIGNITYVANGDRAASKERIEVFGGGAVAILEDFRRLELVRQGKRTTVRSRWRQDKGHRAEMRAFIDAVRGKTPPPIPFEQIAASTLATMRLLNSCQVGAKLTVEADRFMAEALQIAPAEIGRVAEC